MIVVVTLYATLGEEAIIHGINESEVTHVITSNDLIIKFKVSMVRMKSVQISKEIQIGTLQIILPDKWEKLYFCTFCTTIGPTGYGLLFLPNKHSFVPGQIWK